MKTIPTPGRRRAALLRPGAAAAAAALAAASLLPGPQPAAAATLAIRDVAVLPMDAERRLERCTVVVRDGEIVALGDVASVPIPAGAEVIEGGGRTLLPGLVDSHVHLREETAEQHLLLHLAHGVTTVQSMHGTPWHLDLRDRVAAGEVDGPRILTTGPTTATARVDSPERAREVVAEQHAAGYDAIKMYGDGGDGMSRETYFALIEAAHGAGMRVVGHAPRNHPFALVLEAGQGSIDHLEEVLYTWRPAAEAMEPLLDVQFGRRGPEGAAEEAAALADLPSRLAPEIESLARDLRRAGLAVTPTLVAFETIWRQTDEAEYRRLLDDPALTLIDPLTRIDWGPSFNDYRDSWSDRLEPVSRILRLGLDVQRAMIAPLQRAGVPLLAGTDAPLEFVIPGRSLLRELELLAGAGLTPYEALRAATATPAAELGLADAGGVAVGKRADLLLVEGDPLRDLAALRDVAGVVAGGRWLSRGELDRRVAATIAGHAALERTAGPFVDAFESGDPEAIGAAWRASDARGEAAIDRFARGLLNRLGYRELNDDPERAVAAFRVATELFPEVANVWDSLGEGLLYAGRSAAALAAYRRAARLDPGFENPRSYIEFLERIVPGREDPPSVEPEALARLAGDYGDQHVRFQDGRLTYSRGDGEPRPLVPISDREMMIEGVGYFLMEFVLDDAGRPTKIVGHYAQGHQDESPRDP